VKYHIVNPILDPKRQLARAEYLLDTGQLSGPTSNDRLRFAIIHQERMGA
jgi:hypothetical protein